MLVLSGCPSILKLSSQTVDSKVAQNGQLSTRQYSWLEDFTVNQVETVEKCHRVSAEPPRMMQHQDPGLAASARQGPWKDYPARYETALKYRKSTVGSADVGECFPKMEQPS